MALAVLLWPNDSQTPGTMYAAGDGEEHDDEDGLAVVERRWAQSDKGVGCHSPKPREWMEATVAGEGPAASRSPRRGHAAIPAERYTQTVTNRRYWRSGCHKNMIRTGRNT